MTKSPTIITLLVCLAMLSGCHFGGPVVPEAWVGKPTDLASIDSRDNQSRLQIIIGYGKHFSNHAAMRITCPGRETMFWDPGGGFREEEPKYKRYRDLVLNDPPSISRYLAYRWKNCHDIGIEVFEWDITPQYARQLQDVLIKHKDPNNSNPTIDSAAFYGECALAVSKYLKNFAQDLITLNKRYFLPDKLAVVLYTQSPNRVFVFRLNQIPQVCVKEENLPITQ